VKTQRAFWLLVLTSIACGKSKGLGEGLDEAGGRGGEASGGSVVTGAPVAGGGSLDGALAPSCQLPWNFRIVELSELDTSSWPSDDECDASVPPAEPIPTLDVKPLAGRWSDGTGDERLELVLDETGHGTLTLGEPSEWPEPEAEEAYLSDIGALDARTMALPGYRTLLHGFEYSVVPVDGRASELSFAVGGSEPWAEWCALQKPVRGPYCYGCEFVGGSGMFAGTECGERAGCYVGQSSDMDYVRVHCGRSSLCGWSVSVCSCNKHSCTSQHTLNHEFVVALDPFDEAVARLSLPGDTRYLSRQD
jgi:hypothetical protein